MAGDMITYREDKVIEEKRLFSLFQSVGWVRPAAERPPVEKEVDAIANHTYYLDYSAGNDLLTSAFLNSTYVRSAWDKNRLVGVLRVISDTVQRSVFYDFIVHPEYQGRGIGKAILTDCLEKYRHTQITLGTSSRNFQFYEKYGFRRSYNYLEIKSTAF